MMETFHVRVGFTTQRPIIPDQHFAWLAIATDAGPGDAMLTAAQWVAHGTDVVMPTSTVVELVEI